MKHDPSHVAILAARLQRAYPALSPYSAASLAEELARIERAQRRHAERCRSGADGGYVRHLATGYATGNGGNITSQWNSYAIVHDPVAEERAERAIGRKMLLWHSRLLELIDAGGCLYHAGDSDNAKFANAGDVAMRTECDTRGPVLLVRFPGELHAQ